MYFPLGEYLGTIAKSRPLTSSESYASMSGAETRFMTHLVVVVVLGDVPRLEVVANIVMVVQLLVFSGYLNYDTYIC